MSPRSPDPGADEEGPFLVRPYALVRGRAGTGTSVEIPVEAIVVTEPRSGLAALVLERAAIATLCRTPHSVAEVSVSLGLPVGVIRVLVADLSGEGWVHVNLPVDSQGTGTVDRSLLERVLAGLEAL